MFAARIYCPERTNKRYLQNVLQEMSPGVFTKKKKKCWKSTYRTSPWQNQKKKKTNTNSSSFSWSLKKKDLFFSMFKKI